jgi:hypothetical protein
MNKKLWFYNSKVMYIDIEYFIEYGCVFNCIQPGILPKVHAVVRTLYEAIM